MVQLAKSRNLDKSVRNFFNKTNFSTYQMMIERSPKGYPVLDLGCGGGSATFAFGMGGFDVRAIDLDPDHAGMIGAMNEFVGRPNLTFETSSVLDVEIGTEEYAAIILSNIVFFCSEDAVEKLLSNCMEGLRPEGTLFIIGFDKQDPVRSLFDEKAQHTDAQIVKESENGYRIQGKDGQEYHKYFIDSDRLIEIATSHGLKTLIDERSMPGRRYDGSSASISELVFAKMPT